MNGDINNIFSSAQLRELLKLLAKAAIKPAVLIIASNLILVLFSLLSLYSPLLADSRDFIFLLLNFLVKATAVVALFWFVINALNIIQIRVQAWASIKNYRKFSTIVLPMIGNGLKIAIILLMITMLIPELNLSGFETEVTEKLAKVLLICVLGWVFFQVINAFEKLILTRYATARVNDVSVRKIRTQTQLLKKIILTIGLIIVVAAVLMVFDSVRQLGAGLLTTAGVLSAVGAFASQHSLSRLFASLQIAFTQPIRMGDTVIIGNVLGEIEEISFSYVIVKMWNLKRLILPTDYFTGKEFQNLTRTASELLDTVFLYVDHAFPVDKLREKFNQILNESQLWDHKIGIVQVTDMKENSKELRVLLSANNAKTLWDLRCEVREKLINFITDHYANYLPKFRLSSNEVLKQ